MTETALKTITTSFEDHTTDLDKINEFILKIKTKHEEDFRKEMLTERKKELYIFTVEEALGLVGDMSLQAFNAQAELEQYYLKKYPKTPKLGRKLFLEHYEGLHKPYDQVKNRLWKLLFKIKNVKENEDE